MLKETKWFWPVFIVGIIIFLWLAFKPFKQAVIRMYEIIRQVL
jgi:hypothetical protein